jgi:hypothetical protein
LYTEWWEKWDDLPTNEELKRVWDIPEVPSEDASEEVNDSYTRKKAVLVWYLDSWLPMMAGPEFWGPLTRPYKLMTDFTDVNGKEKVLVTVTSEGFGLMIFENCREKWIEIYKYKKINGQKKQAPTYNKKKPETHKYKAKWSDSKVGQNSSWDLAGPRTMLAHMKVIQAFREEEATNDFPRMKMGQGFIKEEHQIDDGVTGPPKKKRKTSDDSDEETIDALEIEIWDE